MSHKFILERDYYDEGFNLYKNKTVIINPGLTVLVGCNGIGKTTFQKQIKNRLKKLNIPYIGYDNLHDGGSSSVSKASFYGNYSFMASAISSSEGENIVLNMKQLASELGYFVKTGITKDSNPFVDVFKSLDGTQEETQETIPAERWILLDAVDSGLSVDNIIDIKEHLFKTIFKHNFNNEIYIIVSANEYEFARGEQCFDVYNGKYIQFKDYEEYRNMILESKKWKSERYKKEKKSTTS